MTPVPIARPDWIEGGVGQFEKTIKLWRKGRVPENLLGWMLVTDCMRVLRAVYGDDLTTAAAIREHVLKAVQMEQEAEGRA